MEENVDREVILASHGHLAEGMLDTIAMIMGEPPCPVRTFCLLPGESPDSLTRELEEAAQGRPDTRFVVLADLFGASVFTSLGRLAAFDNITIVAGMNAALVLAALTEEDVSNEEALSWWGTTGIRGCREALQAEDNEGNSF